MRLKISAGLFFAAAMLTGCSSAGNQLTSSGESVRFVDAQPAAQCKFLGTATGEQSNWLSNQGTEGGSSMRGAANDLRNKAAEMGGNVIYGASTPGMSIVSSFVPLATKMSGQIYKCP
ncbi:DUF4156 domain-containing protein [Tatumella citrea]|uniref:DUF4156 domain-containing protein n=1 Tax=Tatumella citrea TaxID=53336 RepID=A0A1Y0LC33_TATCI|nr:DUF4156 domain-containing protein [Tatumella citrea]ARU95335.1 hypothetical protein A7K98_17270 [Tatumella citrea]ARU99376.1 hypothetical protein A7K99_17255 [Tatumella citrea]